MLKTVINCHLRNRGLQNQTEKAPCTVLLNIFILLCSLFSRFLILFIYMINIRYWQFLFITQEKLGKYQPLTSTLNAGGPLQLYLFNLFFNKWKSSLKLVETLFLAGRLYFRQGFLSIENCFFYSVLFSCKSKSLLKLVENSSFYFL